MRVLTSGLLTLLLCSMPVALAAPVPVERIAPYYPAEAWPEHIVGHAKIEVTVAADGFVDEAKVIAETPANYRFGREAWEAARRWTFEPGKPGTYLVSVKFEPGSEQPEMVLAHVTEIRGPEEYVSGKGPRPKFPRAAEQRGYESMARVIAKIAPDGSVSEVFLDYELPSGLGTGESAMNAMKDARFQPGAARFISITIKYLLKGGRVGSLRDLVPLAPSAPLHRVEPRFPAGSERSSPLDVVIFIGVDGVCSNPQVIEMPDVDRATSLGIAEALRSSLPYWRFEGVASGFYRVEFTWPVQ